MLLRMTAVILKYMERHYKKHGETGKNIKIRRDMKFSVSTSNCSSSAFSFQILDWWCNVLFISCHDCLCRTALVSVASAMMHLCIGYGYGYLVCEFSELEE